MYGPTTSSPFILLLLLITSHCLAFIPTSSASTSHSHHSIIPPTVTSRPQTNLNSTNTIVTQPPLTPHSSKTIIPSPNTTGTTTSSHLDDDDDNNNNNNNAPPLPNLDNRPAIVVDALTNNKTIHYFAVGSNLSRNKLMNRAIDGQKIQPLRMEAGFVKGYRLAFNMKAFAPLEPAMGSIEPVQPSDDDDDGMISEPLLPFSRDECHGALIQLTASDYDRVMRSEGVGSNNITSDPSRGYKEEVVTVHPYNNNSSSHHNILPPITAVTLRCRSKSRLRRDACPSPRYMEIIRQGAAELGLAESYREWLARYPVQVTPRWVQRVAVYNALFSFVMNGGQGGMMRRKWGLRMMMRQWQSWLLWKIYVPTSCHSNNVKVWMSGVMTGLLLFPGSVLGYLALVTKDVTGVRIPPMMMGLLERYK